MEIIRRKKLGPGKSPWVETVASRMGQHTHRKEKPQAEFVISDSPRERPCFNSGTVLTQGPCLVRVICTFIEAEMIRTEKKAGEKNNVKTLGVHIDTK